MLIFQIDFDEHSVIQNERGVAFEELAVWDQEGETYARVRLAFTRSYKTGRILIGFWVYFFGSNDVQVSLGSFKLITLIREINLKAKRELGRTHQEGC